MPRPNQSLSESELLSELEFELELLLLSELEFELELLLLSELEFELELLLLSELEFELELLSLSELEFELELLLLSVLEFEFEELSRPQTVLAPLSSLHAPESSAAIEVAKNDVAMNATVAALARVFIGGFLPYEKQPSVTALR